MSPTSRDPSRDFGDLEDINLDCLGCLLQVQQDGRLSEQDYAELVALMETRPDAYAICPACGLDATVSAFDADVLHCLECGAWSARVDQAGPFVVYAQGLTALARRAPTDDPPQRKER